MDFEFDVIEYNGKPHFCYSKGNTSHVFEAVFAFNDGGPINTHGTTLKNVETLEAKDFPLKGKLTIGNVSESRQNWFNAFLSRCEKFSSIGVDEFAKWQLGQPDEFLNQMRSIFKTATGMEPSGLGFIYLNAENTRLYFRFGVTPETNVIPVQRDFNKKADMELVQSLLPTGLAPIIQTQSPIYMNPR